MDYSSGLSSIMIVYLMESIIGFCVFIFIIRTIFNSVRNRQNHKYFKDNVILNNTSLETKNTRVYRDVSKTKLAQFHISDIGTLKDYFYNLFVEFEYAINDLDYVAMANLATKQMYQNYYTGINLDIKAGKKRIIKDIEKKRVVLFELDSTINKQVASLMIEISYINYMINKAGYIMKGDMHQKTKEQFEVTFRKDYTEDNIIKCPNCGAQVSADTCEYCRTKIKNTEFKISSIKRIMSETEWAEKYK